MPICEFCGNDYPSNKQLKAHQQHAKFCLQLQNKDSIAKIENHICSGCNESYSTRSNLNRHKKTCDAYQKTQAIICSAAGTVNNVNIQNQNIQNIQNVQNIQQNIVINLSLGNTISALSVEDISKKVVAAISAKDVEQGLERMVSAAAPKVFKNEKGNWNVKVADASRRKLLIRTDDGETTDFGGHKAAQVLHAPLLEASIQAYTRNKKSKDIGRTIDDINDEKTYDKKTTDTLLRIVPHDYDNSFAYPIDYDKTAKLKLECKRLREEAEIEEQKETINKLIKWLEKGKSVPHKSQPDTLWHIDYTVFAYVTSGKHVLQFDGVRMSGVELIGHCSTDSGKVIDFGPKELKGIANQGLKSFLSEKYKQKNE
jgi:hypothetical protein